MPSTVRRAGHLRFTDEKAEAPGDLFIQVPTVVYRQALCLVLNEKFGFVLELIPVGKRGQING